MYSNKYEIRIIFFLLLQISFYLSYSVSGQINKKDTLNKKRFNALVIGSSLAYTGTMIGLGEIWYSNFDKQPFTFFDDSKEWLQVDKAGHFYSAFQLSNAGSNALQWSGMSKRKSDKIASLASLLMVSSIEIFDGKSAGHGASATDLLANAIGSAFYLSQQAIWKQTRIQPKFSFHQTYLAKQRPELLGKNFIEELVKDYNGQTYWLSVDVDKFTSFPRWLNLAAGYGAHDMIHARKESNNLDGHFPFRQYYLGLDFDLTAIKTKSKTIKTLLYVVNMIKLPAPTLEFSNKGVKVHAFYF